MSNHITFIIHVSNIFVKIHGLRNAQKIHDLRNTIIVNDEIQFCHMINLTRDFMNCE